MDTFSSRKCIFHQLDHKSKKIKSKNKVRTSNLCFEAVKYVSWTSLTIVNFLERNMKFLNLLLHFSANF